MNLLLSRDAVLRIAEDIAKLPTSGGHPDAATE
jgi:hypothetical protein